MEIIMPSRLLSKYLFTSESFDSYEAFGNSIFQWRLMNLCTLAAFLMNINDLVFPLISRDVEHWCKQSAASNISEVVWRNAVVPAAIGGRLSRCLLYKHSEDADNAESVPCQEWEYDDERARTSIVSEWNLVCDRRLLIVAIVAVHNAGACVFTVAAGSIADHIGRKPVLLAGVTLLIVSTVAGCLSRTFLMLTTIGFFSSDSAGVVMSLAAPYAVVRDEHSKPALVHRWRLTFLAATLGLDPVYGSVLNRG
ncbi:solute carrier family 22 member 7-like [Amblyomma americanum]